MEPAKTTLPDFSTARLAHDSVPTLAMLPQASESPKLGETSGCGSKHPRG